MHQRAVWILGALLLACGHRALPPPTEPASSTPGSASVTAASSASASESAPSPAASAVPAESAPAPAGPAAASGPAAPSPEVSASVTAVSNEIATPAVISPDKVIGGLRPKFNACFADGLKKDPKLAGSVTLSAKIEKDGRVSAVTPKMLTGLSPGVAKCLSDRLKTGTFAPAGGMNYATSLDIPLSFTTN